MVNKPLDLTKPVQTRDGRPVRILCTDRKGKGMCEVVGLITQRTGIETVQHWTREGMCSEYLQDNDLVNVPPPKRTVYLNIYLDGYLAKRAVMHESRASADRGCTSGKGVVDPNRVACIKVEYTEGQFDE